MTEKPKREPADTAVNLNDLEEHGVTIPAPVPTAINVPNPFEPNADGSGNGAGPVTSPPSSDQGEKPDSADK